ncbi:DUF3422 domain-containing protein [Hyphobacterium sp. HN65]|uniref:DUF3422 domain-containing protein n=1 Tax=Hyphobacterium lacteum TaxID=3116575 RepID=A0ABU7LPA9_9PROT|nr:DUF3422 domain-containing protein [Hyphobacterium sp. HN65]MEE2525756.1 DUF3422 domain-containing protein [Hyphobacterium sp. HN65]
MTLRPVLLPQHPDRAAIHAEAHARPPMPIASERSEAWHWVLYDAPVDPRYWPRTFNPEAFHQLIECKDGVLRLERHTEFVALTFFGEKPPCPETMTLIAGCPGQQMAGARVVVAPESGELIAALFGESRLFGGEALFPGIFIHTDFAVGEQGLVTFLVTGVFEDDYSRGRLVKRLLDVETYRMASLLALPLVRSMAPQLPDLERRASLATRRLTDEPDRLNEVIADLAEILKNCALLRDQTRFRIAAALAYDDLVTDRLNGLDETPVGQRQTLRGFIQHRLAPGMQSVRAFERRQDELADEVTAALALARTQLDHTTQRQSQALLASMETRARQQVHLAQAVEGLSVAAITYYSIGLLSYVLHAIPPFGIDDTLIEALAIVPIAVIAALITRRMRKAVEKMDVADQSPGAQ